MLCILMQYGIHILYIQYNLYLSRKIYENQMKNHQINIHTIIRLERFDISYIRKSSVKNPHTYILQIMSNQNR